MRRELATGRTYTSQVALQKAARAADIPCDNNRKKQLFDRWQHLQQQAVGFDPTATDGAV